VFVQMNLSDQESVRQGAEAILGSGKADVVNGLVNCAGVMCTMRYRETREGIELQFGTVSLVL
jgi:NAD(P)-dependent dehydrogenase (short-subunit alcohol dehydrogenase family)